MIQNAIVSTEIIFREDSCHLALRSFQLQWLHRNHQVLLVIKMLLEEVENHIAATTDVRRIHRHLAEEILYIRIEHGEGTQSVPEIVESKDTLGILAHILILERDERTAQLHGIWHVFLQELV